MWPNGLALYSGQQLPPTASWKRHRGIFHKLTNLKWTEEPFLIFHPLTTPLRKQIHTPVHKNARTSGNLTFVSILEWLQTVLFFQCNSLWTQHGMRYLEQSKTQRQRPWWLQGVCKLGGISAGQNETFWYRLCRNVNYSAPLNVCNLNITKVCYVWFSLIWNKASQPYNLPGQ